MFISQAWAQAAGQPQGGGIESMLLIVLMFGVLYFLMIRPQMKRAKEHKAMIEALAKGDEVVSGGGILGRVTKLNDSYVTLEVAQGIEMTLQRSAVQVVLPKGTIKNIS
jgi:preprotein translocase subunit YajC